MNARRQLKIYRYFNSFSLLMKRNKSFEKYRKEYQENYREEGSVLGDKLFEEDPIQSDVDELFERAKLVYELNKDLPTKQTNKEKRIKI